MYLIIIEIFLKRIFIQKKNNSYYALHDFILMRFKVFKGDFDQKNLKFSDKLELLFDIMIYEIIFIYT